MVHSCMAESAGSSNELYHEYSEVFRCKQVEEVGYYRSFALMYAASTPQHEEEAEVLACESGEFVLPHTHYVVDMAALSALTLLPSSIRGGNSGNEYVRKRLFRPQVLKTSRKKKHKEIGRWSD